MNPESIWKINRIIDKKAVHYKDYSLKPYKISLKKINIIKPLCNQMIKKLLKQE